MHLHNIFKKGRLNKTGWLIAFLLLGYAGFAQISNPVKWNYSVVKKNDTYEVHLNATLEKGWHIYSQSTPPGGPVATTISFTKNPLLTLSGKTREIGKLEQVHEELFDVDVKQYSNNVDFVQTVKTLNKAKTVVTGYIEYMVCNDHECLPPKRQPFTIPVK